MRLSRIVAGTAVALAAAIACWWLFSYKPSEFHGAAPMRDTGLFSYHRYHATLGEVPLATAGHYTLRFSGLPSERMALLLYVVGGSQANGDILESLTTELAVQIIDARGNVLCSAAGSPSNSEPSVRWVLMSSCFEAAFWHEQSTGVSFARHTDYVLRVAISNVDPRSPKVLLRATLGGGGVDLP